ncbi:MAG: 2-hydroxyacid dehydrogenase, partial [Hyphomicrobiales bacterium]|nr:2-hydroxyacid dehydrogenase [Hyphomicrobiales bacterium]
RLWLEPDPDAWLAAWAPRIRAVAAGGHHVPVDAAFMGKLPKLEIVASFGVGYEHIDAKWASEHGVIVTHTPGVLDDEVADTAMALVLMAVRRLPQAERFLRAGEWLRRSFPLTASLRGRTMGIVGLGRVGKSIGKRAESFGLPVVYHGRRAQADVAYRFYPSLIEMAKACDILLVAAPGGEETRHLVNAEILRALGPDGVLVNVSRGSLVDERALIEALRAGTILAAGLDVYEREPAVPPALIALDNVVLLPHVGSASVKTRHAMAQLVMDNLIAWSEGKPPLTPVMETPWLGRWGKRPETGRETGRGLAAAPNAGAVDRTAAITAIVAAMKNAWDLPADCNEGELFAYAEQLFDRIEAGESREKLYPFLAEVQTRNLEMAASDAYREIVDRSVALRNSA